MQYHDVTWIASAITEEDRAVAGETLDETARDGSPYRLRLVAHDRQAYDWYYNVVANPMLWFVQHSLWELPYAPKVDAAFHRAWAEGYVAVNASFAAAVDAELERTPDACGVLPRLPPLPRAAHGARAPAGRGADALRAHPVAPARLLAHPSQGTRGARSTTG